MLVLTRKKEESIMIGDKVKLTVVEVSGGQVQLGIAAPEEIKIHRKEVYDKIKAENRQAAEVKAVNLQKLREQVKNND